jgi:hypothetical protein
MLSYINKVSYLQKTKSCKSFYVYNSYKINFKKIMSYYISFAPLKNYPSFAPELFLLNNALL